MFEHALRQIREIESAKLPLDQSLARLRRMSLDEFGQLLLMMPSPQLPHLSSILPAMTPDKVQDEWTGSHGETLLRQSAAFMSFVSASYCEIKGHQIRGHNVLDFGCGYGRLLRLLAYYNDPENNYGCDAWEISLQHSREAHLERLTASLIRSDVLPASLPFPDGKFDLVYAFSIFTHLSEACAVACMSAIRRATAKDGLAIITVRPREFWDYHETDRSKAQRLGLVHDSSSVAFDPAGGFETDKDGRPVHYGNTSIPLQLIEKLFPGWKIEKAGTALVDAQQILVVLRAVTPMPAQSQRSTS